ncbi:MAG: MacB family efflux pump subunit [Cypionkella sp.]|nr:MacB family efflux pump subunit [Cypionkella sp.]
MPSPFSRKTALVLAALLALGGAAYAYFGTGDAVTYRKATVQRGDIEVTVLAAGAIEAKQLVSVGARVSGQIEKLAVHLGQDVAAGDIIAQIDREEQENDLLKARAALAQIDAQITAKSSGLRKAQTTLARQQQLGAAELVSKEALENVAAEVDVIKAELAALAAQKSSAEVNVAQSQLALERATVTAPISGTVVAIVVEEGQTVSAAQNAPTIVKIANLDKMVIKAEISEADVVRVASGQSASFTILGDPKARFDAVVRDVEPAPQQLASSDTIPSNEAIYYNGLLEVDNPDRKLRIGMTAQVSIVLDAARDVLFVPVAAVKNSKDGDTVQIMRGGAPREAAVKTGLTDKVRVEIIQGLDAGDEVVTGTGSAASDSAAAPAVPAARLGCDMRGCDMTPAPLISLRGVGRRFAAGEQEITVLRDVDLDIAAGEFVAIIGASGSGKSTLMNILGCLDRPSMGQYRFGGQDVAALDVDAQAELRREHFGFIFQRYHLLGDLDAVGNVETPAIYAGMAAGARRARAADLLGQLGLAARLDHRPNALSGGQQQRVSVARALMNGGEVILADEPTGALDSKSGADLIALLKDLNAKGHTIIVVTHDPNVASHAGRVIEISDGEIFKDTRQDGAGAPRDRLAPPARAAAKFAIAGRLAEAFRIATGAMRAHPLRSFLTMLGIIIGIASVVLVVALGAGSQAKVLKDITSLGTNTITIRAGTGFGARDSARIRTLVEGDARALAAQDFATNVSPAVNTQMNVVTGNISASAQINGVSSDYFPVHAYTVSMGSAFSDDDIESRTQVAVIDEPTRLRFFPDGRDPVGEVLILGRVPVRVIGVVVAGGANFGPDSLRVWVPYTTAMSRLTGQSHLSNIEVQVSDSYTSAEAEAAIDALMLARHGTRDFFLSNADTIRQTVTSTARTLTGLVAMIAVISLIVGGIGVMNIMLVSVTERTKEIGLRMAIGARQSDIISQFLIEAVMLALIGGVLGIALALGGGTIAGLFFTELPLIFSTTAVVVAFLSSTLIGITFGYLPARSAAKLDPVVALSRD